MEKSENVEVKTESVVEPAPATEAEDYVGPDDPNRYFRAGSGLLWDLHLNEVVDETSDEPPEERAARIRSHVAKVTAERKAARPDRPTAAYPHLVVLADLQPSGGDAKAPGGGDNELIRHLGSISGRHLDLTCAPRDVAGIARTLGDAWPHARCVIDRILRDVQPGEPIRFRPTLLVGRPGSGKTSLVREIGTALGMATTVYPCASVSDNSFGGTPAQWGTRRASTPLEAIRAANLANPVLVLDEIEKTGTGGNHGSLLTSLLPMLERHTASAYFEVGIERPADLSYVGFLATANSLDGVPAPLRDRFRVIEMPDARPEHLGDLARRIVMDIAIDAGMDPAWSPPLAHDELGVIRKMWGGGSLRRLKTAMACPG
nr:AAA family ATPase [Aureimonas jatrophae]